MARTVDDISEAIVIGGGIAGLGAARELARCGWRVTLLEARGRLGGRVFSVTTRGLTHPVELGAEFVHGSNPDFQALLRRAKARLETVSRKIYRHQNGRLVEANDYWKRIAELLETIPENTPRPFQDFLNAWSKRFSSEEIARIRDHVESFNAATADHMSAATLRQDHAGADQPQYRARGGYLRVLETLSGEVRELGVLVELDTVVKRVTWAPGKVVMLAENRRSGKESVFRAARAVVTLPLGVLKAKSVTFTPPLKNKEAVIKRLGWGNVVRVTLRFSAKLWNRRFVKTKTARNKPGELPFLSVAGIPFPVWWVPSTEPMIIGWAGGRLANPLQNLGPGKVKMAALRSLSAIWNLPMRTVQANLLGFWSHDWRTDPFAQGAYSFSVAGYENGPAHLAKPVKRTLYFAGEATAEELGTVHGAFASGINAARRLTRENPCSRPKS
ncbi:MAG: NAD(P)/FAD-dependent oxidoreductase [Nibricoccus sp.]